MRSKNLLKITTVISLVVACAIAVSAQTWERINTPPFFKHHSNGFGIDGKAYVMEGVHSDDDVYASQRVWEYTKSTDSWLQLPDFPGPARAIAIGDDWDGKYYYGFGLNTADFEFMKDVWVFDPADQSFTELPTFPGIGRSHPALIAHNDKVYVGAGSSAQGDLSDWWEYDIITQVWTELPIIPGGNRHHPFQFAIDNFVYVGGGHVDNWLEYHPISKTWSEIDDLPKGRVAGSQFGYKNMGYVLGGDDETHSHVPDSETFMRFNPDSEEWEVLPSLPHGSRWAPSSFILDDELFYFGGISYTDQTDDSMWKFDLSSLDPISTTVTLSSQDHSIYAFPNPVADRLQFGGDIKMDAFYDLSLISMRGEVVLIRKEFRLSNELDLSTLAQGMYLLKLDNDTSSMHIKLIKVNAE